MLKSRFLMNLSSQVSLLDSIADKDEQVAVKKRRYASLTLGKTARKCCGSSSVATSHSSIMSNSSGFITNEAGIYPTYDIISICKLFVNYAM